MTYIVILMSFQNFPSINYGHTKIENRWEISRRWQKNRGQKEANIAFAFKNKAESGQEAVLADELGRS